VVDFASRLAEGLTAHEAAVREANEISQVLRELDEQVRQATGEAVRIGVETFRIKKPKQHNSIFAVVVADFSPPEYEEFKGLGAKTSEKPNNPVLLAKWDTNSRGYPVSLHYSDIGAKAYDKATLEKILGDLLASPETGRSIQGVIDQAARAKAKADEQAKSVDP